MGPLILKLNVFRLCLPFTSLPEGSEGTSGSTCSPRWVPGPPYWTLGRRTTPARASWTGHSCQSTPGVRTRGEPGPWRSTTTPSPSGPLPQCSSSGPWNSPVPSSIPTPRSTAGLTRRGSMWSETLRRTSLRITPSQRLQRQRRCHRRQ